MSNIEYSIIKLHDNFQKDTRKTQKDTKETIKTLKNSY